MKSWNAFYDSVLSGSEHFNFVNGGSRTPPLPMMTNPFHHYFGGGQCSDTSAAYFNLMSGGGSKTPPSPIMANTFHHYFSSSQCSDALKKFSNSFGSSASSFSIDAILGLNQRINESNLMIRVQEEAKLMNQSSGVTSVSPDSTANDHDVKQYSKHKSLLNNSPNGAIVGTTTTNANNITTSTTSIGTVGGKRNIDDVSDLDVKQAKCLKTNNHCANRPANGDNGGSGANSGGGNHGPMTKLSAPCNNNPANNHHNQHLTSPGKAKRVRTIFTPEQLERLESEFERQQYMVGPERLYLASRLNLTEAQVKVWFQNRRIKWRKQHLEMQQAKLSKFCQNNESCRVSSLDGEGDEAEDTSGNGEQVDNVGSTDNDALNERDHAACIIQKIDTGNCRQSPSSSLVSQQRPPSTSHFPIINTSA